jgi:hypothetical protein
MQQQKSSITSLSHPIPSHRSTAELSRTSLTFTTGLPLSLGSQVFLELTGSHLVFFDLLASQAFDLLEELGDFVGHGSRT